MSEVLNCTREGAIARVTLNRPDRCNALSPELFEALVDCGKGLAAASDIRVVILSGAGGHFCSGLDLEALAAGGDPLALLEASEDSPANRAQRAAWIWRELPMPVIASLEGSVFGGGLQIALAADLRIAHPESRLSVMEMRWGIIPDMSITQTLTRLVRDDVARELTYTGRILEATEAAELGLVTRLSDSPALVADDLANAICQQNPHAVRAAKELYTRYWHSAPEQGLRGEAELQKALLGSANQMEAVRARFEKREPHFED